MIGSKKNTYLLKYFPYQCLSCLRFSNEILIVQCGKINSLKKNRDDSMDFENQQYNEN